MVLLVEVSPTTPAQITEIPITGGRRLRTVKGSLPELVARVHEFGDDYLRVYIREPARAGLRDEVLEALPNALEIRIDPEFVERSGRPVQPDRTGRTPLELFNDFCEERQIADPRVDALFSELLDELTSADSQGN